MTPAIAKSKADILYAESSAHLNTSVRHLLSLFQEYCASRFPGMSGVYLQMTTEVLSFYLGYVDGMSAVSGIPRDVRDSLRRDYFQQGKRLVTKERDISEMEGSDDHKALLRELMLN